MIKGQLREPMRRDDEQMRKCISLTCLRSAKAHLPVRSVPLSHRFPKLKNNLILLHTRLHTLALLFISIKRCRCALTQLLCGGSRVLVCGSAASLTSDTLWRKY